MDDKNNVYVISALPWVQGFGHILHLKPYAHTFLSSTYKSPQNSGTLQAPPGNASIVAVATQLHAALEAHAHDLCRSTKRLFVESEVSSMAELITGGIRGCTFLGSSLCQWQPPAVVHMHPHSSTSQFPCHETTR